MKHIRSLTLVLFVTLISLFIWADNGELYTSGKLSSSLINCIVQDKYGYIWIGTEYGLNKFDGYRFTTYFHDAKDSTSITNNTISSFLVDKKGDLWVGSAKGLMRYDYEHNNFKRYHFTNGRHPRIYSIIESPQGDVLIGTAGYGLYQANKGKHTITQTPLSAEKDSDIFFTHIYYDDHKYLWQSSHLSTFSRFSRQGNKTTCRNFNSPCGAPVASCSIVITRFSLSVCMASYTMTIPLPR